MTVTAGVTSTEVEPASVQPRRWWSRGLILGAVAVAVSPIAVGAVSLIGDTWHPAGDWTHFIHRVSQVGTRETPLVGSYTVKGWAHPGPLGFWVPAPLYRLTGSDPRALQWTAALVHMAAIGWLAVVAWRRGRWPLLLGVMALAAVLVHGFSPQFLVDVWNPFLPLTSFLLTIFLAWDAALGRRRALLEAVLPATLAMQSHLAFVSLIGLVVVWLGAWARWWPRLVTVTDDDDEAVELPRPPWAAWLATVRRGLVIGGVLWLAPLFDAIFDLRNPWNIAKSFGSGAARVGLVEAIGLVGRYVRPDGPWMGGPEPTGTDFFSVRGSGALPLLLAITVLIVCLQVARRRHLVDVCALATLALVLVIGGVPAAGQIPLPNEAYLTQWLKVVGGLVWFTVGWTGWRVLGPAVRAAPARRAGAAVLAGGVLVAGAASSWGEASSIELPLDDQGTHVAAVAAQLDGQLPRDQTIRVVGRGEFFHVYAAGVIYSLIRDGYDVVTDDGSAGLKWGHRHRWSRGEPYDLLITVAVNHANNQCGERADARRLAFYDKLSAADRAWLSDVQLRRLGGPDAITADEARRADELAEDDLRIGVFESSRPCAPKLDNQITRSSDATILPVVGGAAVLGLVGAVFVLVRRRRSSRLGPPSERVGTESG